MRAKSIFLTWVVSVGIIGVAALFEFACFQVAGFRYCELHQITNIRMIPNTITVSQDGRYVAGCVSLVHQGKKEKTEYDIALLNTLDQTTTRLHMVDLHPVSCQLSHDGERLAVGARDSAMLVDTSSGEVTELDGVATNSTVCDWAFSKNSEWLAGVAVNGDVLLWDFASGQIVWKRHLDESAGVEFSEDSERLFVVNCSGVVKCFSRVGQHLATRDLGACARLIRIPMGVCAVCLKPSGLELTCLSGSPRMAESTTAHIPCLRQPSSFAANRTNIVMSLTGNNGDSCLELRDQDKLSEMTTAFEEFEGQTFSGLATDSVGRVYASSVEGNVFVLNSNLEQVLWELPLARAMANPNFR